MRKLVNRIKNVIANLAEEKGGSELITVIALIVIVLVVAVVFKNQLIGIAGTVGSKVRLWITNN